MNMRLSQASDMRIDLRHSSTRLKDVSSCRGQSLNDAWQKQKFSRYLFLVIVLGLGACASARTVAWNYYERGLEDCQGARWGECAEAYERSMETGYHVPGIHADYGVLLARDGEIDGAEAQLAQEIAHHPESAVLVGKVRLFLQEGDGAPVAPAAPPEPALPAAPAVPAAPAAPGGQA